MQTDEMLNESGSTDITADTVDTIKIINDLKADYNNKLKAQKAEFNQKEAQYLEALAHNVGTVDSDSNEPEMSIDDRRKMLAEHEKYTSMESCENLLRLREQAIAAGERDPFLPTDPKHRITADEIEQAEELAAAIQECLDVANGDPNKFNMEFEARRVRDGI